jgi:MFS family permease
MASAADHEVWPKPRAAWLVVAVLFAAYIVSFVDRTVLSLLVEPIKADLNLSDVQIGLVSGLAFGVFYSVMGLPLGWLVDRRSRRLIIAVGIAIWSFATMACGLARSFETLFIARILVGVGEAALAPAALSLISDLFPPERRALAVSVFVMAGSVGGGAAMILGGDLISRIEALGPVVWPVVGKLEPWQAVFVAVGLPGLILCGAIAAIREPVRRGVGGSGSQQPDGTPAFVRFVHLRAGVLLPLFSAMTLLAIVAYGFLSWIPSFFIRTYDWSAHEVGTRFGLVFLVFGAAGAIAGGAFASRLRRQGRANANLRTVALGLALLVLPATIAPLSPNGVVALVLLAPTMFFFAFPSGAAAAAVQGIAPNAFRGRTVALYYIVMNLFGLATGAVLVAAVATLFNGKDALGMAMASVGAVILPIATLLARRAMMAQHVRG